MPGRGALAMVSLCTPEIQKFPRVKTAEDPVNEGPDDVKLTKVKLFFVCCLNERSRVDVFCCDLVVQYIGAPAAPEKRVVSERTAMFLYVCFLAAFTPLVRSAIDGASDESIATGIEYDLVDDGAVFKPFV